MVSTFLGRVVAICSRHAWLVIIFYIVMAIASVFIAVKMLDITTDTTKMFSTSMAWKQRSDWMGKNFPQREGVLVAVIESKIPEEGEVTAQALVDKLSKDTKNFDFVHYPQDNPFLVKNGLLFLDPPMLDDTLSNIIKAQPFLSSLAYDPSARGLFDALGMVVLGVKEKQVDLKQYNDALNGFATNLTEAASGHSQPFSWEESMSGDLSKLAGKYQIVVAKPKLDLNNLQPAGVASKQMRDAIANVPYVKSGDVKVYITGDAQLNDEEFSTVMQGMIEGLFASFVLVAGWLFLAARTWRLIFPILFVLLIGLLLTTGFAAIAVGTLNLISVSFAILFVSIAVDFAIQFCVRFRGQDREISDGDGGIFYALVMTGHETGHQIFTAAVAAAAGFLAFTPTNFTGVQQLGLIAGVGMFIAFICTLTLLPALLTLLRPSVVQKLAGFPGLEPLDKKVRQFRWYILFGCAVVAAVGVFFLADQKVKFDADPFHTKNQNSEGMRALKMLMEDPNSSPYTANVIVNSAEQAKEMAARLEKLPLVHNAIWLGSFVPEDQNIKLAMLQNAATILMPTLVVNQPKPKPTVEELRQSMQNMLHGLDEVKSDLGVGTPLYKIRLALQKIVKMPDVELMKINDDLVRFLPFQLNRLKIMLSAGSTTMKDVPSDLVDDYKTKSGKWMVEVFPKGSNLTNKQIDQFVKQIRTIAPDAAGTSVDIVESAKTVVHAFIIAAIMAIVALAIILFIALRRLLDMVLVLMPLILSGLMTVIIIVLFHQPLNFANIITLPLLLGVGVSFNIYFVMNWREGLSNPLSSPTARAVLFSALTTGTAFGSLAVSGHPGTASMGLLLLISLGCTLVATLVFVPASLPKRDIDPE